MRYKIVGNTESFSAPNDLWMVDGAVYHLMLFRVGEGPDGTSWQGIPRFPAQARVGSEYHAVFLPFDPVTDRDPRVSRELRVGLKKGKVFAEGPFALGVSGPGGQVQRRAPPGGPRGPGGVDPTGGTPSAGRMEVPEESVEAVAA